MGSLQGESNRHFFSRSRDGLLQASQVGKSYIYGKRKVHESFIAKDRPSLNIIECRLGLYITYICNRYGLKAIESAKRTA